MLERAVKIMSHNAMSLFFDIEHPILRSLKEQFKHVNETNVELTGVGFYLKFTLSKTITPILNTNSLQISGVEADINGLEHGVGFVLFLNNGRLDFLECFTYNEPFPKVIKGFNVRYHESPDSVLKALPKILVK